MLNLTPEMTPAEAVQEVLRYYGITQDILADHLRTSRLTVNQLCRGRRAMTPAMALRFSKATGVAAEYWRDLQLKHNVREARRRTDLIRELSGIPPLCTAEDFGA